MLMVQILTAFHVHPAPLTPVQCVWYRCSLFLLRRIPLQLLNREHIQRLLVCRRQVHFRRKIRSNLVLSDRSLEIVRGDAGLLPRRDPVVVVVAELGLMERVGHDGRDAQMAFVSLRGAAVAVLVETHAIREEGQGG